MQGESLQQTIDKRDADWAGQCYTDYAFHVMLLGAPPIEVLDQIPETIQAGSTIAVVKVEVVSQKAGAERACAFATATMRAMDLPAGFR